MSEGSAESRNQSLPLPGIWPTRRSAKFFFAGCSSPCWTPLASPRIKTARCRINMPQQRKLVNPTYTNVPESKQGYTSIHQFYPFYLSQHANRTNRRLHITGTTLSLLVLLAGCVWHLQWLWAVPFTGYGFAWFGHFFFERNRPATFRYPLYSLLCDFWMWYEVVIARTRAW